MLTEKLRATGVGRLWAVVGPLFGGSPLLAGVPLRVGFPALAVPGVVAAAIAHR